MQVSPLDQQADGSPVALKRFHTMVAPAAKVDLAENTNTLTASCTSLVHAPSSTLVQSFLSSFTSLLTESSSSFHCDPLTPTSSLCYAVHHLVRSKGGGSSKLEGLVLHLHVKVLGGPVPAAKDSEDSDTDARDDAKPKLSPQSKPLPPATTILFSSVEPGDPIHAQSSRQHRNFVDKSNEDAEASGRALPTRVSKLSGSAKLTPELFDCTTVVLTASVEIELPGSSKTNTADAAKAMLSATTQLLISPLANRARANSSDNSDTDGSVLLSSNKGALLLNHITSAVPNLHMKYARYDEIDKQEVNHFVNVTMRNAPRVTEREQRLIRASLNFDSDSSVVRQDAATGNASRWKRMSNSVGLPVEYFERRSQQDLLGEKSLWCKATCRIDVSAASVVGWLYSFMSYERVAAHELSSPGLLRYTKPVPESRSILQVSGTKFPIPFENRTSAIWYVYDTLPCGSYIVAFANLEEYDFYGNEEGSVASGGLNNTAPFSGDRLSASCGRPELPEVQASGFVKDLNKKITSAAPDAIRARAKGFYKITPLAENVCCATLVTQGHAGGSIPRWVLDWLAKKSIKTLARMQKKFERNGSAVDREVRDAFKNPPAFASLSNEQKEVVKNSRALVSDRFPFEPINSPSPFVDMWAQHLTFPGQATIVVGKGRVVLDCSARTAMGWWFDYCSRERMRIASEEKCPARLVVSTNGDHDNVVATVKTFPLFIDNREFVARQLCCVDEDGTSLLYCGWPVDNIVDYGQRIPKIRGITKGFHKFVPINNGTQCEITCCQYFDVNGSLPRKITEFMLPKFLMMLEDARLVFERDDEHDNLDRQRFANIVRNVPQQYTADEEDILAGVARKFDSLRDEDFEEIASPDGFVQMGRVIQRGFGFCGRATARLDATPEDCAAMFLCLLTRARWKEYKKKRGIERSLSTINQHSDVYRVVYGMPISGISPREWVTKRVWKWINEDTLVVGVDSIEDEVAYPLNPKYLRATSTISFKFERKENIDGTPQTEAVMTQNVDFRIPKYFKPTSYLLAGFMARHLGPVVELRHHFDQSESIDSSNRMRMGAKLNNDPGVYDDAENEMIKVGLSYFDVLEASKPKKLRMISPLTAARIAYEKGDSHAICEASTVIRSSPEQVLTYFLDVRKRSAYEKNDLEISIDETRNAHNTLVYVKKASPALVHDRDFLTRFVWKHMGGGATALVATPEESKKRGGAADTYGGVGKLSSRAARRTVSGKALQAHGKFGKRRGSVMGGSVVIRATFASAMKIVKMGDSETRVEWVAKLDLGGFVGNLAPNTQYRSALRRITVAQEYFESLREYDEWDCDDGTAIGEVLVIRTVGEKLRRRHESAEAARMRVLFTKYKGLRGMELKYGTWIRAMLTRVAENKLRLASDVPAKLCCLSVKNGTVIGAGLAMSLAGNLTTNAGVDEWIAKYPALKELERETVWFVPMMDAMANRLLGEVSWGVKMRISTGAGLSMMDLASDIYVIITYFRDEEQRWFAWVFLTMIAACLLLQLAIVLVNTKAMPIKFRLKECCIVLTGMKPGK
jgi:hypothetical protein